MTIPIRHATEDDLEAVARIYNEGIEERRATFDTEPVSAADLRPWLSERVPLLVADERGFARAGSYSDREAYAGIAEATVYVARSARGAGLGPVLVEALCAEARERGLHKLIGKIFPENEPSVRLFKSHGFREVGVHIRHGRLEGEWRDVLLVERSLGD